MQNQVEASMRSFLYYKQVSEMLDGYRDISTYSFTITFAQKPRKIPATTQSCQNMTRAPRIRAGAISALYMGTVAFFAPMPIPITKRAAKSPCHDFAKPDPIGVAVRQQAVMNISPRRPK